MFAYLVRAFCCDIMGRMPDSTADLIERERKRYDASRKRLFDLIRQALSEGAGPSEIARRSGFTREYIAKIRDGKTGSQSS